MPSSVSESLAELSTLERRHPLMIARLRLLQFVKRNPTLSRRVYADMRGISRQEIESWMTTYSVGGLELLLDPHTSLSTSTVWLSQDKEGVVSKEARLFREAMDTAKQLLQGNSACSQFYGGAGLDALGEIEKFVDAAGASAFGPIGDNSDTGIEMKVPTLTSPDTTPITQANLYAAVSPEKVIINTNGAFIRKIAIGSAKLPRFGNYPPGSLKSRVLQLLHEAGHLVITDSYPTFQSIIMGKKTRRYRMYRLIHLLPIDGGKSNLSKQNTDKVLGACRAQIDALQD
jgi:hypothetical protein